MPFPPLAVATVAVSKIRWLQWKIPSLAFARGGFYSSQFLRGVIGRIFGRAVNKKGRR